jgi:hypothetical protein
VGGEDAAPTPIEGMDRTLTPAADGRHVSGQRRASQSPDAGKAGDPLGLADTGLTRAIVVSAPSRPKAWYRFEPWQGRRRTRGSRLASPRTRAARDLRSADRTGWSTSKRWSTAVLSPVAALLTATSVHGRATRLRQMRARRALNSAPRRVRSAAPDTGRATCRGFVKKANRVGHL